VQIGITREGRWLVGAIRCGRSLQEAAGKALVEGGTEASVKQSLAVRAGDVGTTTALQRMESTEGLPPGLRERLDVVWIMLHGPRGEDGTIQGLLELAGLPYVGAGVLASAVGMDKVAMKDMFRAHGLPVVEYLAVKRHEWRRDPAAVERAVAEAIGFPCFTKPANLGSSVGISKVKAPEDLPPRWRWPPDTTKLASSSERAVQGRVEVAVLGNDQPQASCRAGLLRGEWYDYGISTAPGHTTFKVPAPSGPELTRRVRELASGAFAPSTAPARSRGLLHRGRGGRARQRDNTLPGFTAASAYQRALRRRASPT
jgi:D-alanine-D-alanine ligase